MCFSSRTCFSGENWRRYICVFDNVKTQNCNFVGVSLAGELKMREVLCSLNLPSVCSLS